MFATLIVLFLAKVEMIAICFLLLRRTRTIMNASLTRTRTKQPKGNMRSAAYISWTIFSKFLRDQRHTPSFVLLEARLVVKETPATCFVMNSGKLGVWIDIKLIIVATYTFPMQMFHILTGQQICIRQRCEKDVLVKRPDGQAYTLAVKFWINMWK